MGEDVVVLKDMPKTQILQKGDKVVYFCKKCKQEFESEDEWRKHLHSCRTIKHEEPDEEPALTKETKEVHKEKEAPRAILTPEEEMLEEMCRVLKSQMEGTPGIGSGEKTNWFVNVYFRNNPVLQNSPQELFKALRRHFPRADDDAISWIVTAVFKIKERYARSLEAPRLYPGYMNYQPQAMQPPQYMSNIPMVMDQPSSWMYWLFKDMMDRMDRIISELKEDKNSVNIKEIVEAEVERRLLKEEVDRLNKLVEEMVKNQGKRHIDSSGWSDDYARLLHNLGEKMLDIGKELIHENKKTRRLMLNLFLGRQEERPAASKTDEEIIKELEEEGLVE